VGEYIMPYDRPTITELVDRISGDLQTRITGATTLLRNSVIKVVAKVWGGVTHLLYGYLDYIYKQCFILTADEYGLVQHGSEYGIDREAATKATGNADGTGTNGTVIPVGTEFQSSDGQVYVSGTKDTIAGGVFTVDLTANAYGAAGNQDAATVLNFVSPISGADATVIVDSSALEGGADEEDVEDWREKLLTRKRKPPHGGAEHDYETWAKEVDGVTRAWSFPKYFGAGTIGLAFARDEDASPLPSNTEMATVYDYVVSHTDPATGKIVGVPVTAEPGFFVVGYNDSQTYTTKSIDFDLDIYPETAAVKAALEEKLQDAIEAFGGPGETIYISDLYFVLGDAAGLERLRIDAPAADVVATQQELPIVGTVTYDGY
jgi:uncharacterized phage protein gp47/JayE